MMRCMVCVIQYMVYDVRGVMCVCVWCVCGVFCDVVCGVRVVWFVMCVCGVLWQMWCVGGAVICDMVMHVWCV